MKKTLLLLALLVSTTALRAQKEAGTVTIYPRVGVSFSKFTNDEVHIGLGAEGFDAKADSKFKAGLTVGAEAQYQFTDLFAASVGLLYANLGTRFNYDEKPNYQGIDTESFDVKTHNHALLVPVLAHVYVAKGFSVEAGVQAGSLLKSRTVTKWDTYTSADGTTKHEKEEVSSDTKDFFHTVDLSIPVGVSYEWRNINVDLRYHLGLTKVYKYDSSPKNSTIMLTVGYGINL